MLRSSLRPVPFVALALLAWARPAAASEPASTYAVPSRVELLPNDAAATRVVIHGAFFNLIDTNSVTYAEPRCGVMYFQCVSGQEAMCRLQWQELQSAISPTPTLCRGFGTYRALTTATTYAEGEPLGTPDAWDLGMGISPGAFVDSKCPIALKLSCPLASPLDGGTTGAGGGNAGAAGAGGGGGAAGAAGSGAAGGASGGAAAGPGGRGGSSTGAAGGSAGGSAENTGVAGTGSGAGTAGTGEKPAAKPGGGCAIAGTETSAAAGSSLALLAVFALLALAAFVSSARPRRR